ncbi:PREDICTED: uncharacterized protein LOC106744384 isoform X1 [Dinoponera quadriceps]|uniref:Uncharacterized protein LOC106744384 isoform X1 n=1 Tax=Dinoponera quadriceps TaxID=609295 RepID=A0A6P3X8J7_DINQU|nr:PREDICTED: uncharacterized protein LOC106744384 isoform X1 [Dinoponera quadriceps]XP_014474578.1 PREDICTED: uncharacterized protein LOC106744384 isoform X1 [Dinoponera quadriceps]XP_014474579.1 PREDICTED: uncharacterized protein LOC106744384 isoform X1 [Dinoponera quadriceps]XP_014474580.1 PREDICTED: uncharacterized protein LOC106744384 isoform X1 [Dinoponera quadriceps]XP_014474582.1 PREDICTED: uncharacterized protein LOC106744384 isoform X1 [Dinoponera quadriceps]XP_014474583.1 PREDICTED:
MYVFYPADELLRIYENREPLTVNDNAAVNADYEETDHYYQQLQQQQRAVVANGDNGHKRKKEKKRESSQTPARRQICAGRNDSNGGGDNLGKKGRREEHHAGTMQNNRAAGEEAANPLKDLTQPSLNEPLKQHNGAALKLVQTVSEFAQELGAAMESHSANVRRLVDEFRSRSGDSRVDTGGMRRVWESLLRQVEADAVSHLDLAAVLQQQLSRPTLEASFHRKLQSRKVFAHRDAYEQVVSKTEEKLQRARLDYKRAYAALLTNDGSTEQELKRAYLESHNAYILQLRATNAITERYQFHCLPGLLGEIAEVYEELCGLACKCVAGTSEAAGERAGEQTKRYQVVTKEAQAVIPSNDLQVLARNLSANTTPRKPPRRLYVAPAPPEQVPMERISQVPMLRDELVPTGTSTLPLMEDLRHEYDSLTQEIGRLQDALDALVRMQRKSAESNLYTKVAELQEDISLKRFDLGVAQLRLAAVQAQKELFGGGEAGQPDGMASRKMSNGSTGSPKLKWLKAFKSLKTSSPTTPPLSDKYCFANARLIKRKAGDHIPRSFHRRRDVQEEPGVRGRAHLARIHLPQDHTVRRVRPGTARSQPSGCPMSRLQGQRAYGLHEHGAASALSEPGAEERRRYTIAEAAKDPGSRRGAVGVRAQRGRHIPGAEAGWRDPWKLDKLTTYASHSRTSLLRCSTFVSEGLFPSLFLVHFCPQRRRERLNLRMKSLSLDSPEGTAHVRHRPRDYYAAGQRETTPPRHSDSGSINRLSPCSPGQSHGMHKHVRSAIRMSSMELPDENEKSYSSASTSPCPSPHANNQNHLNPPGKRVLPPNNLYVVLYNFEARHRDELDLKAGYKVTVIDKSEKDWWKGKCLGGRAGYFPSAYVMRIESGQKTLQVTRNLQLADQTTLLRDQIVIQVGDEVDGVAMVRCAADVRSADHTGKEGDVLYKEILCPLKYLQEV